MRLPELSTGILERLYLEGRMYRIAVRLNIGAAGALIRGLPAGDYCLNFTRVADIAVNCLGTFSLVYGADRA